MRKFNLIAGLPRAGSTLLCNLLNMNENFHVTPTSAILDTLKVMRSNFSHDVSWKAQNRLELANDFKNGMKGFVEGFFADRDVVFDKSRGWPTNFKLIDDVLGNEDTKLIFCYRDPVEIVGSIEAQYQKTSILENADEQAAPGAFSTLDRRIGTYINDGGLISYPIESLRDAIEMGYANRILFIKYYDLTNSTQEVLNRIHQFIGEPTQTYTLNQLTQSTNEYDGFYNYKFLHTITEGGVTYKKSDVELPTKYVNIINEKYAGINKFIFEGNPSLLLGIPEAELETQRISIKLK